MRAWGRMRNFIILKRMCGFKGQGIDIEKQHKLFKKSYEVQIMPLFIIALGVDTHIHTYIHMHRQAYNYTDILNLFILDIFIKPCR